MAYPLILLVGQAGSGKDTCAGFLKDDFKAQPLALADPMKRLARHIFGFNADQLWGPSEARNAPDPRFTPEVLKGLILEVGRPFGAEPGRSGSPLDNAWVNLWLDEVLRDQAVEKGPRALFSLHVWYRNVLLAASDRGQLTPRYVLQTLGTEWGRAYSKDIWVDYAIRAAKELLAGGCDYSRILGVQTRAEVEAPSYVVLTDGRFRNEVLAVLAENGVTVRIDAKNSDDSAVNSAGVKGHSSETEQKGIPEKYFSAVISNDKSLGLEALRQMADAMMWRTFQPPLFFQR